MGRIEKVLLILLLLVGGTESVSARSRNLPHAGQPLSEALEALRDRGLNLVYSSNLVRPEMRVASDPTGSAPREIAEEILAPHGLSLREGPGGTLLVVRRAEAPERAGAIFGRVRVRDLPRPVAGAAVRIPGSSAEYVTDADGRFLITDLPAGTYSLEVRGPGFRVQRFAGVPVAAGELTEKDLEIAVAPGYVERVVVSPAQTQTSTERSEPRETFSGESLNQMAQLGGDIQRSVVRLPGAAGGDKSATVNIRGGDRDEVQVVLDGLEISEPFHLKDFLSFSGIVDSGAIGGLEYLSGGYPVEYAGRMSGVLDLTTKEPTPTPGMSVAAGLINFEALAEGASADGRSAWLAAARKWYPDAVFDLVDPGGDPIDPSYYDLLGKVEFRLAGGSLLGAHLLTTRDRVNFVSDISVSNAEATASDGYAWMTLATPWSARLDSRTVLSVGRLDRNRDGLTEDPVEGTITVHEDRNFTTFGARQDWTLAASDRLRFRWGFDLRHGAADYDYAGHSELTDPLVTGGGPPVIIDRQVVTEPSGNEYGVYASGWTRLAAPLAVEAGLRWDRQTVTDENELSPRLNLVYVPDPRFSLRAAWGRFYQPQRVDELQVEDGVSRFYPAQLSEHRLISAEWLFAPRWRLRTDAYMKEMSHLRPRYENLFDPIELFPEGEGDRIRIAPDRAEAKGVELLLRAEGTGRLDGWAGITLASVEDVIDGERIPRSWDQRQAFSFGVNYGTPSRWNVNLSGIYHSGWPTTAVTAEQIPNPGGPPTIVPQTGPRNAERYPSYHRMDLKASRSLSVGGSLLTFYAEITNLYEHKNVCCVDAFSYTPEPDGTVRVDRKDGFWLERVPSAGIIWRFGLGSAGSANPVRTGLAEGWMEPGR